MASAAKAPAKERPVPPPGAIPYITSPKPLKHIEWLQRVFGADLKSLMWKDEKGKPVPGLSEIDLTPKPEDWEVMHAELFMNGAPLYLSGDKKGILVSRDDASTSELLERNGGRGFMCALFVDDVHKVWKAAIEAKATVRLELNLQFWGAWYGIFEDPFGYTWSIAKHADEAS